MSEKERPVVPRADFRSYYGQPILKKPSWHWYIPAYFAIGGASGVSGCISFAARLRGLDHVARRSRLTSLVGMGLSGALLIKDLGRPARFFNMMRVAKLSSPMSVGTWIVAGFSPAVAVGVLDDFVGLPLGVGFVAEAVGGVLGAAVATYTAVLVADTAIPAWSQARGQLPALFAGSASASAAGLGLLLAKSQRPELAAPAGTQSLATLAIAGAAVELGADRFMHRHLGELARPYQEPGAARTLHQAARACTMAGALGVAASSMFPPGGGSSSGGLSGVKSLLRRLAGATLFVGSVCERFAIFHAGIKSAEDPQYVIQMQKHQEAPQLASS